MHAMQLNTTETLSAATLLKFNVPVRASLAAESFGSKWQQEVGTEGQNHSRQLAEAETAASRRTALEGQTSAPVIGMKPSSTPDSDTVRSGQQVIAGGAEGYKDNRIVQPKAASEQTGRVDTTKVKPRVAGIVVASARQASLSKAKHAGLTHNSNAKTQDEVTFNLGGDASTQRDAIATKAAERPENSTTESTQATKSGSVATKASKFGTSGESGKNTKPLVAPIGAAEVAPEGSGKHMVPVATPESTSMHAGVTATLTSSEVHSSTHVEAGSPVATLPVSSTTVTGVEAVSTNHSPKSGSRMDAQLAQAAVGAAEFRAPQVIASSPASLDVGVFDGTHGWLKIRAELGTGGAVSASLTASASAHESLRAALPQMANYLGSEAVSVSKIALHRFGETSNSTAMAPGEQQSGDRNTDRQNAPRESGANGYKQVGTKTDESETGSATADTVSAQWVGETRSFQRGPSAGAPWLSLSLGTLTGSSGGWLNVTA
jgi:hypothetical protein